MPHLRLLPCALILPAALLAAEAAPTPARVPVLLELFTSEGCSSCPPADRLLETLSRDQPVAGARLIVLSEHVDYWNRLGWKDPFSSAVLTARQQEYDSRLHLDTYTPQLIVNGRNGLVGSDRSAAIAAIQGAAQDPGVKISIAAPRREKDRVTARIELPASAGFDGKHAVLYAVIADEKQKSQVTSGENSGRALVHVHVARLLRRVGELDLGAASDREVSLPLPPREGNGEGLLIVFLQDAVSGRIWGSAEQPL